jgi:hypothetical protein
MLPCLSSALRLYDEIAPSPNCPPKLEPLQVGATLAEAIDFDLNILWAALSLHFSDAEIKEIKLGLIEHLTHEHDFDYAGLSDVDIATRLQHALDARGAETTAILMD